MWKGGLPWEGRGSGDKAQVRVFGCSGVGTLRRRRDRTGMGSTGSSSADARRVAPGGARGAGKPGGSGRPRGRGRAAPRSGGAGERGSLERAVAQGLQSLRRGQPPPPHNPRSERVLHGRAAGPWATCPFQGRHPRLAGRAQPLDRPGAQVCKSVGFFKAFPHTHTPAVTRGFPKDKKTISFVTGRCGLKKAESLFWKGVLLEGD